MLCEALLPTRLPACSPCWSLCMPPCSTVWPLRPDHASSPRPMLLERCLMMSGVISHFQPSANPDFRNPDFRQVQPDVSHPACGSHSTWLWKPKTCWVLALVLGALEGLSNLAGSYTFLCIPCQSTPPAIHQTDTLGVLQIKAKQAVTYTPVTNPYKLCSRLT